MSRMKTRRTTASVYDGESSEEETSAKKKVKTIPAAVPVEPEEPEEKEVQQMFTSLDMLQTPVASGGAGLSVADVARLVKAGYGTVEALALTSSRKIAAEVEGFSDVKTKTLKDAVGRLLPLGGFCTGAQVMEARKKMARISTGSASLDAALQGGMETGGITELFGECRTGKSQLCHSLAVMSQLDVGQGGIGSKAVYIDTEGTFRPERLVEIGNKYGLDEEKVLNNVVYSRVYSVEQQMKISSELGGLLRQGGYGLVIVDSITALFRAEYQGRGELAERQQLILKFVHNLQRISDEYGVAVVLTNQVSAAVDAGPVSAYVNPSMLVKPVGGHVLGHATQTRLFLRKAAGEKRICRIFDSPLLPEVDVPFMITSGGVADWKDPKAG